MKFSSLWVHKVGVAVCAATAVLAYAQTPDSTVATERTVPGAQQREQERQLIAAQRQALQAHKAQAEKACGQRFAVEDCLREVRSEWRAQEQPLRTREIALNHAERQEKAAARLQAIEQKQQEKRVPPALSTVSRQPDGQQSAAQLTQAQRQSQAQARAQAQAQRWQKHQQDLAERERTGAQQRAEALQTLQSKQQAAQARRERKADEIAKRTGAPLPVPSEIPAHTPRP